ncbi:hypothetical protein CSUI_010406 [Cystoisospora suis]|uniref:Uncharacterized protein n=1 Tax=Cystoisospora suis TaxID=483139 RepID=A0A2C6KH20_9APIC|nr:hypothetical protein CSUI_010406 [Cystoisospora suis]
MFPHTYHCEAILYLCRQSEVDKCRKELQVNRKKFSFISFPPKIEEWTYLQQDTPHPLHPSLHSQPSAASHPLSDLHFHPHSLGDSVDGKVQSSPTAKAPPARTSTTTRRRKRTRTRRT